MLNAPPGTHTPPCLYINLTYNKSMTNKGDKTMATTAKSSAAASAKKAQDSATKARKDARIAAAAVKELGWVGKRGAGFMNFLREQGVVGLAVGLAIGTAAGDTVKKLVQAFIDPVVQLLIGSQQGLQAASFTVEIAGRKGVFMWGAFVSSLITLLAVAFVVYFIVKGMKLDKLDKKKDS